jgi:hypothetical protein
MHARPFLASCTALLVAAVPLAMGRLPAAAGDHSRSDVQVLTGPSPFAAGCPGRQGDALAITGAEVEPTITADPADPRHLVATWQQDIGRPAARSDLIATSADGGRTWRDGAIPGLTVCAGGIADFASDPWLSIGGDGTVYFSGLAGSATAEPPPVAIVASRSLDGGRTWEVPTTVAPAEPGNDTDSITASPTRDGHAYLVWAAWDHSYQPPMSNAFWFARSADRGASWQQEHLAGPFDLRTAPNHRLGGYQGLAGLRRGFVAVVTMTGPPAQDGPSGIVVARVGAGRHEGAGR